MKATTIKEIGVFNVEGLEVTEGRLEIRVPVDVVSEDLNNNLDKFFKDFSEHHPKVQKDNISFEARIIFDFGYNNPEFSLELIIFDSKNHRTVEFWDELEITLSEDAKKQLRRIAWQKFGEAILNL